MRHESLRRLLEVAKEHDVVGPASLAAALNESEQVITNWGSRGVSRTGAMKAQAKFGCDANWVLLKPQVNQGSALPIVELSAPEVKISQSGYELSEEAIELARWFDRLTDEADRNVAMAISTNAITQRMAIRDAARLAVIVGQPAAPTIPMPAPVVTPKKASAKPRSPRVLPNKR